MSVKSRSSAVLLTLPLALFILVTFIAPLGSMFLRSLYDPLVADIMPDTVAALDEWDGADLPPEHIYELAARELEQARENKTIGRLATRLNRDTVGLRSVIMRTGRGLQRSTEESSWARTMTAINPVWGEPQIWRTLKRTGARLTPAYYLNALDRTFDDDGNIVLQPEERRIYIALFIKTIRISLIVTLLCLLIGYPVAYLITYSTPNASRLLLALVLVPFWTSLLVRTTSWIVLLQQQGVINDLLVWLGIIPDEQRLAMVHNMTGTLVAMTYLLLPFMIMSLYSVMRGIPVVQMQAATSLGASWIRAFCQIYLPQSLPGIGAGCLLVFTLAIGYYITPALVGGQSGQLISNFIAYHIQTSLNWGLAAALGSVLFIAVLLLFLLYDRVLGIDRMKPRTERA